jgi:hypothetical protein
MRKLNALISIASNRPSGFPHHLENHLRPLIAAHRHVVDLFDVYA